MKIVLLGSVSLLMVLTMLPEARPEAPSEWVIENDNLELTEYWSGTGNWGGSADARVDINYSTDIIASHIAVVNPNATGPSSSATSHGYIKEQWTWTWTGSGSKTGLKIPKKSEWTSNIARSSATATKTMSINSVTVSTDNGSENWGWTSNYSVTSNTAIMVFSVGADGYGYAPSPGSSFSIYANPIYRINLSGVDSW